MCDLLKLFKRRRMDWGWWLMPIIPAFRRKRIIVGLRIDWATVWFHLNICGFHQGTKTTIYMHIYGWSSSPGPLVKTSHPSAIPVRSGCGGLKIQSIDSICFAICGFITNSAQPSQVILGSWRAGTGFLYQVYPVEKEQWRSSFHKGQQKGWLSPGSWRVT